MISYRAMPLLVWGALLARRAMRKITDTLDGLQLGFRRRTAAVRP
jgi:hypothetical protein